jgi:hypothetical protein
LDLAEIFKKRKVAAIVGKMGESSGFVLALKKHIGIVYQYEGKVNSI